MKNGRKSAYALEASSDIGGFSPWLAQEIWQPFATYLDGMEVIAWRWSTPRFLRESNFQNLPVTRLHGPMVRGDMILPALSKIGVYDWSLLRDTQMVALAGEYGLGMLTHEPHAANGFAGAVTRMVAPTDIWVENHEYGDVGLLKQEAIILKYAGNKHKIHLMVDMAHYTTPWQGGNFTNNWVKMIERLEYLTKTYRVGVHFPIGDLDTDSLPILDTKRLTDGMLVNFKPILDRLETMVFEYQSPKFEYLLPPQLRIKKTQERLKRVFERLAKAGIV